MSRMLELDGDHKISAGQHVDLESQQTVLLIKTINPTRNYTWGKIFAMFRACRILISIKANKDAKGKQRVSSSAPALLAPNTDDLATEEKIAPRVAGFSRPISDQVVLEDVHSEVHEDDGGNISSTTTAASDARLQHANISKIVRTRDLDSSHKFGGVQGIAQALNTDLDGGIPDDEQDLPCRCGATALSKPQSITEAPAPGFFGSILGCCNCCTILLLSLAAVLSIGFGIKEEGLKTGWYEGVVIIIAIIILVAAPGIRGLWLKHSKKLFSKKKQRMENSGHMVVVLRAKTQKQISIPEIVLGDIVCLERGSFVHVDGLFISGEFLVVHDGLEATVDEKAPFLFHGSKVTNGNGQMLVTSIGMDTELGELMSKAVHSPNRTSLPTQLDKLRMFQQIAGLLISILILIVLFLRFMLQGEEDADSGLPDLKGDATYCWWVFWKRCLFSLHLPSFTGGRRCYPATPLLKNCWLVFQWALPRPFVLTKLHCTCQKSQCASLVIMKSSEQIASLQFPYLFVRSHAYQYSNSDAVEPLAKRRPTSPLGCLQVADRDRCFEAKLQHFEDGRIELK